MYIHRQCTVLAMVTVLMEVAALLTVAGPGVECAANAMSFATDLSEGSSGAHFWKEVDI